MKCFWRRTVSIIICIAMILTLLPQSMLEKVSAAVNGGQSPEYRQEIIDALAGIVGGDEKAQDYYRMLQDYGLLDEDGNILDSWYIEKDGKPISLDEIREILAGDYDPQDMVWVDGAPVCLEDLKTMIDIEDYLAYVKDTYFTEKVWTKEQTENAKSLVEQLEREGILLRTASNDNAGHITGARDVSHDARVKVTLDESSIDRNDVLAFTARFSVSLTGAVSGQQVSFKYMALSGSRSVKYSGVIKEKTLTAGADGTATGEIDVDAERVDPMADSSPVYAEKTYFVLDCFDVKNALFTDSEGADSEALGMLVECKGSTAPGTMPECISFNITGSTGVPDDAFFRPAGTFRTETVMEDVLDSNGQPTGDTIGRQVNHYEEHDPELLKGDTVNLTAGQQLLIKWGLVDNVAFDHIKEGDGLKYSNPADQYENLFWIREGNHLTPLYEDFNLHPQTRIGIHAENDPEGVDVQIPTDEIGEETETLSLSFGNKKVSTTRSRLIQPATWEYIVRKNGANDDWYNYSRGYRPNGTNLNSWDFENLLPVGGTDVSLVSTGAAISKGDVITSLTFDGGFAYYPLKILTCETKEGNDSFPEISWPVTKKTTKIHTLQYGAPDNKTYYTMNSGYIYNNVHHNERNNTDWTPPYYAEFLPGTIMGDMNHIQPFYAFYGNKFYITAQFSRSAAPKIESISVPACEFKPGELIPITVKYSEPAQAGVRMTVNRDTVLTPMETSASNVQTFIYEVKENGSTSILISVFDPRNLDGKAFSNISEYLDAGQEQTLTLLPAGFKINAVVVKNTFTSFVLKADNTDIANPKLNVTVGVANDIGRTGWLAADMIQDQSTTEHFFKSLRVRIVSTDSQYDSGYLSLKSVGDNVTGGKLTTGDIVIDGNTSGSTGYYIAELYLDNGTAIPENASIAEQNTKYDPVIGKYNGQLIGIGGDAVPSVKFVTESDLTTDLSVKKSDGTTDYVYNDQSNKVVYVEDKPVIKATFSLAQGDYTYGNPQKVTYINSYGNPANSTADFAWVSSDPSIAVIGADGKISPTGKAGETIISVIAYNGNAADRKVTKEVGRLKFDSGNTPFFEVPNLAYDIVDGQGLTVYWSSNICAQNGTTPTTFDIKLYRATDTAGTPVYTTTVSGTGANPVSQAAIPAEYLAYTYEENGINSFVIKVSTEYHDTTYSGEVKASVESLPAKVSLKGLSNYYILDTAGNVVIEWNISNFAKFSSTNAAELFEMSISRDGREIYKTNTPGTGDGQGNYRGTYSLGNIGFNASSTDKNGYRQVYTVSVKAKNGTSGTWSYDSFLLYVYDEAALKIWIQPTANDTEKKGKATGTVISGDGSTASSLVMDNAAVISNMTQDQILALKGDISLRNVISANYGEYAWTELSDQLAWASDNNAAVTINYRQGSLYEDIRKLSYDSYRPGTDLLLSGLKDTDKPVTVTAEHVLTGMKDSLEVSVKTLKNRLYLFRCYPQIETTLTYYDKNGVRRDVVSDANGEAAIYEENGICSDVYCKSVRGNEEYLATIHNSDLRTGEGDSTKLELYPYNLVTLRKAAYAYVYLKNPNGTPYTGSVILRGAVYVNDEIVKGHVLNEHNSADNEQIRNKECFTVIEDPNAFPVNWISFKGSQFRTPQKQTVNGSNIVYDELSFGYKDNYLEPYMPDGALKITMDVSQWELTDSEGNPRALNGSDKVKYVFTISAADSSTKQEKLGYYPILLQIDANATEDNYVKSGDSIVTFRENKKNTKHPFIIDQRTIALSNGHITNVIDYTGRIGVSDSNPDGSTLETIVMWWGEEPEIINDYSLQLYTSDGRKVAYSIDTSKQSTNDWIFARDVLTRYDVTLTADSIKSCVDQGQKKNLYLEYKRKNYEPITRREDLPFALANLVGVGKTEESRDLASALRSAGKSVGSNGSSASAGERMSQGDEFVGAALSLLGSMEFTDSEDALLSMNITPTNDPTKFLGLMSFSYSTMDDNEIQNGVEMNLIPGEGSDFGYTPAIEDLPWGGASKWLSGQKADLAEAMDNIVKSDIDVTYEIGGYMETLIYWDFDNEKWAMTVLDGGFNAGGGLGFKWDWNMWVGPVPITMEVELGGTVRVSMDAITTAYQNNTTDSLDLANEYLTKLRLYLYIKVFAGVGIDYSVVALKLGIFGQISLDMTFEWLNRPYLSEHQGEDVVKLADKTYGTSYEPNINGQRFRIDGLIGIEFVASIACVEYEKVFYSVGFNMMDEKTGHYSNIEHLWEMNQKNLRNAIDALAQTGSMQVNRFGSESFMTLDLAPRAESRDYLNNTETKRTWGGNNAGAAVARTAKVTSANALRDIETNTYPYATPKIVNSGDRIIYLSDMNSADINATRAVYATKNVDTYEGENHAGKVLYAGTQGVDDGFGDTQLDTDYDGTLTVATWVRRMVDNGKVAGQTLSNIDQMVSLNGTEIYASVINGVGDPVTTRLTNNTGADVAPTAATRNGKAMVAWRSVAVDENASGTINISNFNKKDTIKCRFYDGSSWSNTTYTVYNGSSGNVKGLDCAMLTNGTAAIAYTLDTDGDDTTTGDREIVYAVINPDGTVARNIRVTNNNKLDENPAIEAITVGGEEEFVLGWYSSEVQTQATGSSKSSSADICMIDFNRNGEVLGRIPGSLSQTAGGSAVNATSNFSFVGGGHTLDTLGIAWVERAQGNSVEISGAAGTTPVTAADAPEYDVLKAVMFYSAQNGSVGVTSVIDVAEMPEGTLIDSFDTTVGTGRIEAVVLGTTYGSNGVVQKTGETKDGSIITYSVPSAVSNLYRVTEELENKLTVTSAYFDRSMVRTDSSMSVQYALRNDGIDPIKNVSIKIGTDVTNYNNINIVPGGVVVLRADHNTGRTLTDADWTVTAEFNKNSGTETKSVSGRLLLDYPDIEVTSARVVEEKDGKRQILIKLNNASDALLYKGVGNSRNRQVGISFYTDATLQNEIVGIDPFVIDDSTELEMIDNGGYSKQVTFNIAAYLQSQNVTTIPEAGIPIYVAANVLEYNAFGGTYAACPEPDVSNNSAMVSCDNLQARTGKDVVITNDMEVRNGQTIVTVDIQNTSLASTRTGNLIVSLMDENHEIIEQKQSYTGSASHTGMNAGAAVVKTGYVSSYGAYQMLTGNTNGLITLGGEQTATQTFTFNHPGYYVDVAYTNLKLDSDNTELGSLSFSEIGINEKSFKADGTGRFVAEAKINKEDIGGDIVSTVIASAKSPYSTVKVTADNGTSSQTGNLINEKFTLAKRDVSFGHQSTPVQAEPQILIRKLTVTVTADNGKTAEYVVNITYVEPTQPVPGPTPGPTPGPVVTPTEQEPATLEKPVVEEKKEEKVKPLKAPAAERKANAVKLDKKIGATQKNGKLSFTWGKVKDAEYYNVYVAYYGDPFEKTEPVTVEDATKFSTKKIGGKKIDQTKNLKFKVVAMKTEDGKPVMLGESLTLYIAGAKNAEYTNVALIKLSKTKKTLTLGKTFKIKADVKLEDEKKKMLASSAADLRYESTDTSVAKVSASGKITTVGKGTCYIRVYSLNGVTAKIKVTVE